MSSETSETQTSGGARTRRGESTRDPSKYVLLRLLTIGGDQVKLSIGPDDKEKGLPVVTPVDALAVYGVIGSVEAHSRAQAWELCKADEVIRGRLPHQELGEIADETGMWLLPESAIAEFAVTPTQGWEVRGL